ncbi:MAG: 4-hydroxy-tetrahydrodipicolinate reductase [Ferruginibacter sp.]|nr:4-hydroxy-tetrahydrodipicolinate reductase [Ferruginibacter sp.]
MKIALIGYGKMGKAIEEIAMQKGHEIVLKISKSNVADFTLENVQKCDVAIEFTNPESAIANLKLCINSGVPVICGSTGWGEYEEELQNYCKSKNGSLLHSSNFSIGVNIFFEINKKLAHLMATQKEYNVAIEEIHHTQKKDAPSGTAITIAKQIISERSDKNKWVLSKENNNNEISITSKRIDPAPGTHIVSYNSVIDNITIIHTAHNRQGFAFGAVLAAEYILGKKGIFGMKDVLNF